MSDNQCANCLHRDRCPAAIKVFCGGMKYRTCCGKDEFFLDGDD